LPFGRADLQDEVLAFDIAERVHPLQERLYTRPISVVFSLASKTPKHTDPGHACGRLRLGCERHHEETEGEGEEQPNGGAHHGHVFLHMSAASVGGWAGCVNRDVPDCTAAAMTRSASFPTSVKDVGSSSVLVNAS
jgi:hypothetical protein